MTTDFYTLCAANTTTTFEHVERDEAIVREDYIPTLGLVERKGSNYFTRAVVTNRGDRVTVEFASWSEFDGDTYRGQTPSNEIETTYKCSTFLNGGRPQDEPAYKRLEDMWYAHCTTVEMADCVVPNGTTSSRF